MKNLVVLISGRGSNLQSILSSPVGDRVSTVISNNADAKGLTIARQHNKKTLTLPTIDWEQALANALAAEQPTLIALAGFMKVLSPNIVATYTGRLVNIHPSLLPKYPGLHTHRRVLSEGETTHGCTVHWVSEAVDSGEIIAQREVPVLPDDDEQSLESRVLAAEHILYPQTLVTLLSGQC